MEFSPVSYICKCCILFLFLFWFCLFVLYLETSALKARAVLRIKQLNICENINIFKDLLEEYCMSHTVLSNEYEMVAPSH